MTTTIRTFAALVVLALSIVAIPARATVSSITVRIVDRAAVDAALGACPEGRRIVVVVAGRTNWSGYGASDLTVDPVRPDMAFDANLSCNGELEGLPAGVDVAFH